MTYTGQTTTMTRFEPWTFRDRNWFGAKIAGYHIDAIDGEIGKVDRATFDVGSSYLIVDTGPWIFGEKVMLPAGVVSGIDHTNGRVFVERTKDQIKNAPKFDDTMLDDVGYRDSLGRYYGEEGKGWYQTR
jgi:hypothetical protein